MDHNNDIHKIILGDSILFNCDCIFMLSELPEESVHCCVTSPPYWGLRDYGVKGQIGTESTPEEYVHNLTSIFSALKRTLRKDGTFWLNIGDTYKNKHLVGIPWRVALALKDDGWILRSDIIWHKPNAMPENLNDRPTNSHEYLFLFSKSPKYYYDPSAILEPISPDTAKRYAYGFGNPKKKASLVKTGKWHTGANGRNNLCGDVKLNDKGRNKRTVWTIPTNSYKGTHFAVFPPKLVEPCILAGCPKNGTVLDPFAGSGTTGEIALQHGYKFIGCELNKEYFTDILCPRIQTVNSQMQLSFETP